MRRLLILILTAAGIITQSSCGCAGLFALEFVTDPVATIGAVGEYVGESITDKVAQPQAQELKSKPIPSPGLK